MAGRPQPCRRAPWSPGRTPAAAPGAATRGWPAAAGRATGHGLHQQGAAAGVEGGLGVGDPLGEHRACGRRGSVVAGTSTTGTTSGWTSSWHRVHPAGDGVIGPGDGHAAVDAGRGVVGVALDSAREVVGEAPVEPGHVVGRPVPHGVVKSLCCNDARHDGSRRGAQATPLRTVLRQTSRMPSGGCTPRAAQARSIERWTRCRSSRGTSSVPLPLEHDLQPRARRSATRGRCPRSRAPARSSRSRGRCWRCCRARAPPARPVRGPARPGPHHGQPSSPRAPAAVKASTGTRVGVHVGAVPRP